MPSSQPSVKPTTWTIKPTMNPSGQPTSSPTSPSGQPTRQPTSRPTSQPSLSPTSQPTSKPSQAITLSEWKHKYGDVNMELVKMPIDNSSSFVVYSDLNFEENYIYGGCSSWNILMSQTIRSSIRKMFSFTSVSISFVDNLSFYHKTVDNITCSNSTLTQKIAIALNDISYRLYDNSTVTCNGHVWKMKYCSFQASKVPAVCVDCEDPCLAMCSPDSTYYITPCNNVAITSNQCSSISSYLGNPRHDVMHNLIFVRKPPSVPTFDSIILRNITANNATVDIKLSDDGVVYCGTLLTEPSTVLDVKNKNIFSYSKNKMATITLESLTGSTKYNLYCFTESFDQVQMSYSKMLTIGYRNFQSACCKGLNINILTQLVRLGISSINAFELTVEALPQSTNSLIVLFELYNANGQQVNAVFAPSYLNITSSSQSTFKVSLYLSDELDPGSYTLSIPLDGSSSLEYLVESYPLVFDVKEQFDKPNVPTLTKIYFADSGSYILVKFDSRTNLGGIVM